MDEISATHTDTTAHNATHLCVIHMSNYQPTFL